jgi:hypothetical protein
MWAVLLFVYAVGAAITAPTVLRNRVFSQAYVLNVAAVLLWPIYWSLFLSSMFVNRAGGGPVRPPK